MGVEREVEACTSRLFGVKQSETIIWTAESSSLSYKAGRWQPSSKSPAPFALPDVALPGLALTASPATPAAATPSITTTLLPSHHRPPPFIFPRPRSAEILSISTPTPTPTLTY
ncbi:hypothetical protein CIHG_00199 [Coccidioides immitis H538.4]|uniref:Uncharacterized protein n=3 Tax=Coccidioides immitis TaxID=5501 RepID=A0A0J8QID4_COCIT|nr:hypothetical protein CIRG_07018 [Coccidioides immitis RMSCC 2394]KMU72210.1 hypothetical protein CISG_00519 [Coccidioides immitis RMSCC 3703]KMU82417.1 hypothetical protein CIHG_00199 [Coccidioides immitis H538.4]